MQDFGLLNWIVLVSYLSAMVIIGLLASGKQKTADDFFLAGRKMPWLIVGMSMFASLTSASTFMGVPGIAFSDNVAIFFGVLVSPIAAPVIIALFYPFYKRLNITTSYEYILYRFGKNARLTISGLFILARLGWLGVVIYSPALALHIATGINLNLAILLMAFIAISYTVLGGLKAVLWTDVVQFVILTIGAVWVAASITANVPGGLEGIFSVAKDAGKLNVFVKPSFFAMSAFSAAFGYFFIFMQDYGVDQITVQRLMAVGNSRGISKSIIFNSITDVVINGILLFIGLGLFVYYSTVEVANSQDGDNMLAYYIVHNLPNGINGLVITGIFAAAMSSMDSGINSLATVVINDFIKPFRKKEITDTKIVSLARVLTILLGIFALAAAYTAGRFASIVQAWNSFVSLFSAPVLAIFTLGMLTKSANFKGWCVGAVLAIMAMVYLDYFTKMHWIYNFPVSFGISFIIGLAASLVFNDKK